MAIVTVTGLIMMRALKTAQLNLISLPTDPLLKKHCGFRASTTRVPSIETVS